MQFEISDEAAILFAEELYTNLIGRQDPIDAAVSEARKAIYIELDDDRVGDAGAVHGATPTSSCSTSVTRRRCRRRRRPPPSPADRRRRAGRRRAGESPSAWSARRRRGRRRRVRGAAWSSAMRSTACRWRRRRRTATARPGPCRGRRPSAAASGTTAPSAAGPVSSAARRAADVRRLDPMRRRRAASSVPGRPGAGQHALRVRRLTECGPALRYELHAPSGELVVGLRRRAVARPSIASVPMPTAPTPSSSARTGRYRPVRPRSCAPIRADRTRPASSAPTAGGHDRRARRARRVTRSTWHAGDLLYLDGRRRLWPATTVQLPAVRRRRAELLWASTLDACQDWGRVAVPADGRYDLVVCSYHGRHRAVLGSSSRSIRPDGARMPSSRAGRRPARSTSPAPTTAGRSRRRSGPRSSSRRSSSAATASSYDVYVAGHASRRRSASARLDLRTDRARSSCTSDGPHTISVGSTWRGATGPATGAYSAA